LAAATRIVDEIDTLVDAAVELDIGLGGSLGARQRTKRQGKSLSFDNCLLNYL
jgi:hypothetical protein